GHTVGEDVQEITPPAIRPAGRGSDETAPWRRATPVASPPGTRSSARRNAGLGLRGAGLRLLPDDEDFLTVHLDGAPGGRRLPLRLRGALLTPLAQLLLQVLEHPLPPAGPRTGP